MTTVSEYYKLEQENKRLRLKLKNYEENSEDWERIANIPEWDVEESEREGREDEQ